MALGEAGILANLDPGKVYVDLSTNAPSSIRKIHAAGTERGVNVLDAPVSGGVKGAETRRLAVMVGGEEAIFERCKPMLDAIGDQVVYCGGAGNGSVTKLVNNMISLSLNMLLGEALTLGVKAGVDLETLVEVIQGSSGMTRKMGFSYPDYLFKGNFEPGLRARSWGEGSSARHRPGQGDRRAARLRQPRRATLHRGAIARLGTRARRRRREADRGARWRGATPRRRGGRSPPEVDKTKRGRRHPAVVGPAFSSTTGDVAPGPGR